MSGMTKEEKQKRRAERNIAKRELELKKKREKQQSPEYQAKEKAKREAELKAIHNIRSEDNPKNQKVREKFQRKANTTVGTSKENKKWVEKRKRRYNERVWRGWRESDGRESPVTTYKLEDLNKE